MTPTSDTRTRTVLLEGRCEPAQVVGSKAAMLDRVIATGAPVPTSGVVTTAAYQVAAADPRLSRVLQQLRDDALPAVGEMAAGQRLIDDEFRRVPVPADLEAEIGRLGRRVADGALLAVRSSATAEDLGTASFAGQYRTQLHVAAADLLDAVRTCWASLWYPSARAYRRLAGVADDDLAMAVLVMPMLAPESAGVVFTVDPTDAGCLRIEAVEGLGEALVSGARTPSVMVVDRSDLTTLEPSMAAVASTALRLEAEFEEPLDIEWAAEGDTLWVLQARPITTAATDDRLNDGFDVGDDRARYTTAGIAEMLPGVLGPRSWEINGWLVEEGFRVLFSRLGADGSDLWQSHALLGRFRGRVALHLDAMERIVESIPGGSVAELEHQYFGDVTEPPDELGAGDRGSQRLRQAMRTLVARARAFRDAEVLVQTIALVVDAEPDESRLDDHELVHLRHRVLQLGARAAAAEMIVASMATAGYRGLEVFLTQHLGAERARIDLQRLTAADPSSRRIRRALEVDTLVDAVQDVGESDVLACESWSDARALLSSSATGQTFLRRFEQGLHRAGSMSVFGGATWEVAPDAVWTSVRAAARSEAVPTSGRLRADTLADIEASLGDLATHHRIGADMVDVRRRFLRREVADTAAFLDRREEAKAALLMLGGVLWRIDRELGRRLVQRGAIEETADLGLLTAGDVRRGLRGDTVAPGVLARRRRRLDAARLEPPLPTVFLGRPTAPDAPPLTGDVVVGWPGSPGLHEGRARIVESAIGSGLRRGDVLVAHSTDPSWLPLFHIAGAIVVEEGGPLSHASILARELGMPAVLNVPGIVERVRAEPECVLTVDGTSGEIAIRRGPGHDVPHRTAPVVAGTVTAVDGAAPVPRLTGVPDVGEERRHVFVTGLIGAGAMMSFAIGMTQAVGHARSRERIARWARPRAEALATGTVNGFEPEHVGAAGLRSRRFYVSLGSCAAAVAALLGGWTVFSYVREPSSSVGLWRFAFGLSAAVWAVFLATVAFGAARRWPSVSAVARRLSLIGPHGRRGLHGWVRRREAIAAVLLLLVVVVAAVMVTEWESSLRAVDEWVADRLGVGGGEHRWWAPESVRRLLRKEVMIPLAVALTMASYRCRPLLLMTPLAIAAGGFAHLGLQYVVERGRPGSTLTDSFPGGRTNELTIMLGLLPIVVYVLTRREFVRWVLEVGCGALWLIAVADQVLVGDHWPSDNLAGVCIGAAIVLAVRGVLAAPGAHRRCAGCPAQQHRRGAP